MQLADAPAVLQIGFDKFLTALSKIAEKKGQSLPEVVRGVLLAGGPTVNSTKAHYIKFHDDKVDPSTRLPAGGKSEGDSLPGRCTVDPISDPTRACCNATWSVVLGDH